MWLLFGLATCLYQALKAQDIGSFPTILDPPTTLVSSVMVLLEWYFASA